MYLIVLLNILSLPAKRINAAAVVGMHKKSIEAARKLEESGDEDICCDDGTECGEENAKDREERRSESIAALRAKAQTYSAQILGAVTHDELQDASTRNDEAAETLQQQQCPLATRCGNENNNSGFEPPKNDGLNVHSNDVTTGDSYTLDQKN